MSEENRFCPGCGDQVSIVHESKIAYWCGSQWHYGVLTRSEKCFRNQIIDLENVNTRLLKDRDLAVESCDDRLPTAWAYRAVCKANEDKRKALKKTKSALAYKQRQYAEQVKTITALRHQLFQEKKLVKAGEARCQLTRLRAENKLLQKKLSDYPKLKQHFEAMCKKLREVEKEGETFRVAKQEVSGAYRRIRGLVDAWDTLPSGTDIYEVTEQKIRDLLKEREACGRLILSRESIAWGWNGDREVYGYYLSHVWAGQSIDDVVKAAAREKQGAKA